MAKLIEKLQQLVRSMRLSVKESQSDSTKRLPAVRDVLDEKVVRDLMQMIGQTREEEYSCQETFAVLDQYVELATSEEDAALLMPLVKQHIDLCVDCRDHYETLLRIMQSDSSTPTALG